MKNEITVTWQSNYNGISVEFTDGHEPTEQDVAAFERVTNNLPSLTMELVGRDTYDTFCESESEDCEPPFLNEDECRQVLNKAQEWLGDQYTVNDVLHEDSFSS